MAKGIYRRGNIYWIRYAGLDGRIVRESSGSIKFREAEALLIQRRQSVKEGKQPEIKRIANHTFKELAGKYLSWVNGRQRSAETKGYIMGQLLVRFGNLPLRRFNTVLVEQLQTDIINKGRKPSTDNKTLNILKHMFSKAVDWEMVEADTLKRIRKVKQLKDENRRLRYIAKEEGQTLINSCEPHLNPIVTTALNTGMRKSEILKLEWEKHIDMKHNFILLNKTKNGERREIPINQTLRVTLQKIMRRIDVPYVFYDPKKGKPYKDVKRSFKTALRRAKIQDFKFHDLRHTFASNLIMAGRDITTVSKLLGHKSLTLTLRYAHLAPSHMAKAVDILDNTINQQPSAQKLHILAQ